MTISLRSAKAAKDEKAFSIPHTRRHIKFIGEVENELTKRGVKYRAEVEVAYEAQESSVVFYTVKGKVEEARRIVEWVSKHPPERKTQ